jgi:acyl carrier protein
VAIMERSEIFTTLTKRLGNLLEIDPGTITSESTLLEDLDADSLDILELIVSFRDEFGITVSDGEVKVFLAELARFLPGRSFESTEDLSDEQLAEVAKALTVGAIADFIEDRMQKMEID